MREQRARVVLLLQAIEEADRRARLLPVHARAAATRRAMMVTGLAESPGKLSEADRFRNGETAFRRARLLFDGLSRMAPKLPRVLAVFRQGGLAHVVLLPFCLLVGLVLGWWLPKPWTNFPQLGLAALTLWNVFYFVRIAMQGEERVPRRAVSAVIKWSLWRALRIWKRNRLAPEHSRVVAEGLVRFSAAWKRFTVELTRARVLSAAHFSAIVVAAGAVAAFAARGRAALDWTDGVAFLVIGVPRLRLALRESARAARLAANMPLNFKQPYFRRVFGEWRGETKKVEIIAHGYRPRPGTLAGLRTVLNDFFGARAGIRVRDPVLAPSDARRLIADLEAVIASGEADEHCYVLLVDAASVPDEKMLPFFAELQRDLLPGTDRMLLLLDRTYGPLANAESFAEAHERWRVHVETLGLTPVDFAIDRPTEDLGVTEEMILDLRAGLWPRNATKEDPSDGGTS